MLLTNNRLLTILGLSLSLAFFNSCEKKATETTVEEDQENVEKLFDDIVVQAEDFKNGCGVKSVDNFFNLENGTALNQVWADDISYQLELALDYNYLNQGQTNQLDFSRHAGTYQWMSGAFTKSGTPTDKVIIMAPSSMGQTTNNATATVSDYTQQSTTFDGTQYWLPNSADVTVQVDNNDCIGITLEKAVYDNGTFMMPIDAAATVMMAPFEFEIASKQTSGTSYDMSMTARNDGDKKFSIEGNMTFSDSDFSDFTSEDIDKAEGEITYGDFTMPFTINIKALFDLLNPNQTQINEMVKVSVEYKGMKIADLEFTDGNTESIVIIYKDGTREDLNTEYQDLVDRLEVVFSDFINQ
ncbi:MAG: hypothetical protein ACRBFS_12430 [Aureispira sp.]